MRVFGRQIGKGFRYMLAIIGIAGAFFFFMALRHPREGVQLSDAKVALSEIPGTGDWASPTPQPTATPSGLRTIYRYAQQEAHPSPTPCQACEERRQRYQQALATGFGKDDASTLETPQVLKPDHQPGLVSNRPAPPHTVLALTWIYATLLTGINSDHPGDVIARVSQDVKDSVSQTEVLIPEGSVLHGIEGGRGTLNQDDKSLLVEFDMVQLPNGAEIQLPHAPATTTDGYPGLEDQVNHHYLRLWSPVMLIAAITGATSYAENPSSGSSQTTNTSEQQALGASATSLGSYSTSRLSQGVYGIKPTITIRPGMPFRVMVARDMTFEGAYAAR